MDISSSQCRAARALLGITQDDLATLSRVSRRTIAHFEQEERQPVASTLEALKRALEAAGVTFIPKNGGGAGVRLSRSEQ